MSLKAIFNKIVTSKKIPNFGYRGWMDGIIDKEANCRAGGLAIDQLDPTNDVDDHDGPVCVLFSQLILDFNG